MRARNIKPGFFTNEDIPNLSHAARLLYIGLWCLADRAGRLEDRPKRIQGELFRWEPRIDIDKLLTSLAESGFIVRYQVNGIKYIAIPAFSKHQTPHVKERASTIPAPDKHQTSTVPAPSDSLIPDTPNPDSPNPGPPNPPDGGQFVLSSESHSSENGKYSASRYFSEEFWPVVWRKVGKGAALKAFKRIAKTERTAEMIRDAAKQQGPILLDAASKHQREALHPATWLNQGRYDDEISASTEADPW